MSSRMHLRSLHPVIEKGTNVTHPESSSQAPRTITGLLLAPGDSCTRTGSGLSATMLAGILAILLAVSASTTASAAEPCPNEATRNEQNSHLSDCRAYELVSPAANKNGADVLVDSGRTRAASDGNAVQFASPGAFGDAVGTGVATDYMSVRSTDTNPGTNGWSTHAITPVQAPLSLNGVLASDPLYVGDFSDDLSRAVFRAWSPLTSETSVARVPNLYVRRNLRNAGAGTYELATPCPLCDATSTPLLPFFSPAYVSVYAGASDSFDHVLFESVRNLTSDAPAQAADCADGSNSFSCLPRAYEWDAGQLRLVGQVPSGADTSCGGSNPPCIPATSSLPGRGVGTLGALGRPANAISKDGQRIFFTSSDRVYVRTAHSITDEVSASERTDCAVDPTCGPNRTPDPAPDSPSPAAYWGASADGSRVFFTTSSALTDNAPLDGDGKLYVYDTTRSASDPHNLTLVNVDAEGADLANSVQAVIGVSDTGGYVYFVASGQLVAGEEVLGTFRNGIYMWHDGDIDYIGEMLSNDGLELQTTGGDFILRPTQSRVTPDGRFFLLTSHAGGGFSVGYDHGACQTGFGTGCREVYVYSAEAKTLVCASCNPSGEPATTDAATGVRVTGAAYTTWHLNRAITDDGRRMFFSSSEALVAADINGRSDVYEYDVPTAQVYLLTSGTHPSDAYFMDASPSGSDVFFVTHERLVGWDVDTSFDLYDARVGGGFPEPIPAPVRCSGPACQGTPAVPLGTPPGGSDSLDGRGNLSSRLKSHRGARRCKQGFVKRRIRGTRRCVKRRSGHRKHANKRAGTKQPRRTK